MIKPHKYLDINNSVLGIGAEVLKILGEQRIIRIDDLEGVIRVKKGDQALLLMMPSLNLLFALNKIEYHQRIDSIEYIE